MNDLALTGIPRGGTTLACRLLGQAEDTLALFEPMPVEELAPASALDAITDYFAQVRAQVLLSGTAPSKLVDGQVPDNPYGQRGSEGAERPWLAELGTLTVDKPLSPHFRLVIKHNAAFTALLPTLATRLPVLGIVRNPLAVLASWRSVDLPVSRGRLTAGERLDPALARRLDAEADVLLRQIMLLDWMFDRLQNSLPASRLLRYEAIVETAGACLLSAAGITSGGAAPTLASRNANAQYHRAEAQPLAQALCRRGGAWLGMYPAEDIRDLARRMDRGT